MSGNEKSFNSFIYSSSFVYFWLLILACIKKIAVASITLYQGLKRVLRFPSSCRFTPSCSQYMKEVIERHGIIRGLGVGVKRILRCHPWNKGGWDPAPK